MRPTGGWVRVGCIYTDVVLHASSEMSGDNTRRDRSCSYCFYECLHVETVVLDAAAVRWNNCSKTSRCMDVVGDCSISLLRSSRIVNGGAKQFYIRGVTDTARRQLMYDYKCIYENSYIMIYS
jgi:hypothetical protein